MDDRKRNRKPGNADEPATPGEPAPDGDRPRRADSEENENASGEEILIEPEPRPSDEEIAPDMGSGEGSSGGGGGRPSKEREYLADLQRVSAEFANYKKRTQRERVEWEARAKADLLSMLLPILDDLDRARAHWSDETTDPSAEGMRMILTRFESLAFGMGLERQKIEPGTPFDPHRHEALAMEISAEHPEGVITEVLQPGYTYKGILLRPARVRVSQRPPVETPPEKQR